MNVNAAACPPKSQVYAVLSPRSLRYALGALADLFRNSIDPVDLHLITDSESDRETLSNAVSSLHPESRHAWSVTTENDLADAEASRFAGLSNLRSFRHGHPCWRKVTDPLLMSADGEEIILLDPDVCFPNRFRFEETPATGLKLMWQRPTCLFPPEVVRRAIDAGVRLAHHVDIGVAHWRGGPDLGWLDWLIGRLGGDRLPRLMHVEAIVWAALAMREGGSYLDPRLWVCWHRTQAKRLQRVLGATGADILSDEAWHTMKCFHGGGEAKWLMHDLIARQRVTEINEITHPGRVLPFVELTPTRYAWEQRAKNLLRTTGYYRVFGARHA